VTTDREAMQQALEALDRVMSHGSAVQEAKDILRERLAQPETVMAEYRFQTYAAYKTDGELKIGVVPEQKPEPVIDKSAARRIATALGWVPPGDTSTERVDQAQKQRQEQEPSEQVASMKEDIIKLAQECQLIGRRPYLDGIYQESLERFAALVAQHERERIIAANAPEIERVNAHIKALEDAVTDEREACAELVWPTHQIKTWSEEELTAMTGAFNRAQEKHGWYETIMAVGAAALKDRAAAIRSRGQT
jgi:hypothetical protein